MSVDRVLAMVLAGGEGTRLAPLTAVRSKPAVPFGARYRIIDFVLSNLVNSEIYSIYILVQYKSQPLIEHIRNAWVLAPILPHHFVTVVPPQMHEGPEWFQGTADGVYQNLDPGAPLEPPASDPVTDPAVHAEAAPQLEPAANDPVDRTNGPEARTARIPARAYLRAAARGFAPRRELDDRLAADA